MQDEFRPREGRLERHSVQYIAVEELDVEAVQCCTGTDVDGPHRLPSGDEGPHDVGPQVPRRPRDNESHPSPSEESEVCANGMRCPERECAEHCK